MIVVPALHPAHDVIVRVDALSPGAVHRVGADAMVSGVGGKSVNVALAIASMGVPVRLVVCGDEALLAGLRAEAEHLPDLDLVAVPSPVPTRTDLAVVDARGGLTVINGTASDPGPAAMETVTAASLEGLGDGDRDVLVLAGSTPDGTRRAHPAIARAANERRIRVVVDASGPALAALLETHPEAVKISADEAREWSGAEDAATGDERPSSLASVPIVGITDGAVGLRAWVEDGPPTRVLPPPGMTVVATLGAGDAVTAGLAIALARGDDPLEGFILGTAMAVSTLDHLDPSVDPVAAERLRGSVRVTRPPRE